ncbi:HAD-IA family hydrolase [Acidimangrovimonas pyrenivorans]|uniref:HAD-IA family hydrolase n=1 Tax=Acidimangrovimonas pyrenivorans TaxID=2030798 RepID=A0ABV7AFA8_9RHOB
MTPSALIFDVDGTLAETEEAHRAAFNRTFDEAGLNWHWDRDTYRRLLKVTGGKERMRAYAQDSGTALPDAQIVTLHAMKTAAYGDLLAEGALALRPGVAALIDSAHEAGLKIAVATTTSPENVEALTRACWGKPAGMVFDAIAAGDMVPAKKPAPDIYHLALSQLDLPADRAIAFEDSANGLKSARKAGLRVVVTPGIYTAHEDHAAADWLLPSLAPIHVPDTLRELLPAG